MAKKKVSKKTSKKKGPRLLKDLRKEFTAVIEKDGIVESHRLSDSNVSAHPRTWISTGSLSLDRALTPNEGEGRGVATGRVVEVVGPAHIGKSTLLDTIFASVQRMGGLGMLIETDAGRDQHYSTRIGVNVDELEYLDFKDEVTLEGAIDSLYTAALYWKENAPDIPVVIGFDAIGVTPTKEEVGKTLTEGSTASAAKILRKACRKLAGVLRDSNIAVILLNHEYTAISFGGGVTPKKAYGGEAIGLLASVRLRLNPVRGQWIEDKQGRTIGRRVGFKVTKFKLGPAYTESEFLVLSGSGIDNTWTLWEGLSAAGLMTTSGAWRKMNIDGEDFSWQGWPSFRQKMVDDPELYGKLVNVYRNL